MHCPLESLAAVFAHEEECQDARSAFEKLFPLPKEHYPRCVRASLAGLSKGDYPSLASARELLSALFSKEEVDVSRFLKGLLRQVKRVEGRAERSRLVTVGAALFNHVHKGAPLTLERLKQGAKGCEEAMIEDLAGTPYWGVALQLGGQLLERKVFSPALAALLQNPAVLHDPLAKTHYRTLRSLGKEADCPAACLSLFLLYYDPKAKPPEEGAYLERLLQLREGAPLKAEEKKLLSSVALDLVPKVMKADLPLARRLVELLTRDPAPVEREASEALLVQCIPQLLLAKDQNDFAHGITFLINKIREGTATPAAAAKSLKEALSSVSVKEAERFKEMVELLGSLNTEYFIAQNGNTALCMKRSLTSFKGSLDQVAEIARGASALERAEWMKGALKLGTEEAFAACTRALAKKEVFGFLEADDSFWLEYIALALTWDQAKAVSLFLKKEEQLQQSGDFDQYLDLVMKIYPWLPPSVQAQEDRFAGLFARLVKEGAPEKKMAAVQQFAQQFSGNCSSALAPQALQVLCALPLQTLKTEAGIAALSSIAQLLPGDPAAGRMLTGLFGKIRQSAGVFEGARYAPLTKKALEFLLKAPASPQMLAEMLSILQFALKRNFPEDFFYQQMTSVLAGDGTCWTEDNVRAAHGIVSTAFGYFKNSAEEPFLSLLKALFAIPKRQLETPSSTEEMQRAAALWGEFIAELRKKCSRAGSRTVSVLALHQIVLQCAFAKKLYETTSSYPIAEEVKLARRRFVEAADKPLFCSASHLRESVASLSELMLMHPDTLTQILPTMKPYNFKGPDYLELAARLQWLHTTSQDYRFLTEIIQTGFHLFSFPDLAHSLSDEETKQAVHKYISMCIAELKKPKQEKDTLPEGIVVKTLELLVLASKRSPEVLKYVKEHEGEFLKLLEATFARVVVAENPVMFEALKNCMHYMLKNNWAQGISRLI